MAKQGRAGAALGIAAIAVHRRHLGVIGLTFLAPVVADSRWSSVRRSTPH